MRISIFGLGYVGAVTAACFAHDGHEIVGVDVDSIKLDIIRSGASPIVEERLSEMIKDGVGTGRIQVTSDSVEAIKATDASLICVGTPSRRNGSLDMSIVCQVSREIGAALRQKQEAHLIIVRSTVLPGTVNKTLVPILEEEAGKQVNREFDVCFNPEFLREGTSVRDFYSPPFTVVGVRRSEVAAQVQAIYQEVRAEFLTTTVEAAEMIKCACNGFHALKIAYANEIGNLCKVLNIDSHEVMRIFCADNKLNISPVYLKPGFAFGGSCLPKDLRALEYQANSLDQPLPLVRAILPSNAQQIERTARMVLDTGRKDIGLLGLSFKQGTDDLRESPLVTLAEHLIGKGLRLRIYDSNVALAKLIGANRRYVENEIPHLSRLMETSLEEVFRKAELIIIGHKTPEFAEALLAYATERHTIIDLARICNDVPPHLNYHGIAW